GKRLGVVAGERERERAAGVVATGVGIAAHPLGAGPPRVEEREVARVGTVLATDLRVDGERLVQLGPEMVDHSEPPREPGREGSAARSRTVEARDGVAPAAALELRVGDELLEPVVAGVGRHELREPDDVLGSAAPQQRPTVAGEQPRDAVGVAGHLERARRLLDAAGRGEPVGRAPMVLDRPLERQPRPGVVAHEADQREPADLAGRLEEETALRQARERLAGAVDAERLAEGGREAIERRDGPDELAHGRRLALEDLLREVREERSAGQARTLQRTQALARR